MQLDKKHVYAIDFILIVGTLVVAMGARGYSQPLVISPEDELETSDSSLLFEFEKADTILIDDNVDFSSPDRIYVKDNLVINLKPGVYYWKVSGAFESDVRKLTIISNVELRLRERGDSYEVVNSGNEALDVGVYNDGKLTGKIILDINESKNARGDKFVGGIK